MKDVLRVFSFVGGYKRYIGLHILFTFLGVIFSVFSLTMTIPFLNVIFGVGDPVTEMPEFAFDSEFLMGALNYQLSLYVAKFGISQSLFIVVIWLIVFTFFKTASMYIAMYWLAPVRQGVVKDLRNSIFRKVLELPLGYYSEEKKGDIMLRMTGDIQEIEWSVLSTLQAVFRSPITILVYLGTMIFISWELTLLAVLVLPFAGYLIGLLGRSLRRNSKKAQDKYGFIMSIMDETLGGIRVIKAFVAESKVLKTFLERNESFTRIMTKIARKRYLASPLTEFLGTVAVGVIIWFGGKLVISASLEAEAFIFFVLIFSQIIPPAKTFTTAQYNIRKGMASADRVNEVLDTENPIQDVAEPVQVDDFKEKIEYKNIVFKYRDEDVIKDVTFTINKGETVALVGPSGSGKTTLADLLPRFYDVQKGDILIDGNSIKDIKLNDLRGMMGNVNQEPILFNDTIYNNIAFGVDNATKEDVENAARIANAHEFIEHTDEGYQTNIGDRGTKLSGGQRQRLSIARAVLKNPQILILDEATSALDTESERLVQDALDRLLQDRTSLVIAHRLSTIVNADRIIVIEEGEIKETGTHEELLGNNGLYKKLYNMQSFN